MKVYIENGLNMKIDLEVITQVLYIMISVQPPPPYHPHNKVAMERSYNNKNLRVAKCGDFEKLIYLPSEYLSKSILFHSTRILL